MLARFGTIVSLIAALFVAHEARAGKQPVAAILQKIQGSWECRHGDAQYTAGVLRIDQAGDRWVEELNLAASNLWGPAAFYRSETSPDDSPGGWARVTESSTELVFGEQQVELDWHDVGMPPMGLTWSTHIAGPGLQDMVSRVSPACRPKFVSAAAHWVYEEDGTLNGFLAWSASRIAPNCDFVSGYLYQIHCRKMLTQPPASGR